MTPRLLRGAILCCLVACAVAVRAQVPQVVEIWLNGEPKGTLLLLELDDRLLVAQDDARSWGLRLSEAPGVPFAGRDFVPLETLGVRLQRFDRSSLRVDLAAEPSAFAGGTVTAAGQRHAVSAAGAGGFGNYDLLATHGAGANALDGAFELGAFSPWGVVTHQFVLRNLWHDDDAPRRYERVNTTVRRDWLDSLLTLELGDAVSVPGATGRALRFGGVALRSNFALRPGFIRQPLPAFGAETALPSTVEVYVQNQLRSVSQVPAGPFTIDEVPVILGAGQARIVVRDALGREQVVTSSFYAAGGLLRPGLHEMAFAAGKLRNADSRNGPDYGNDYAAALWRRGVSDSLTLEARAEYEAGRTRVLSLAGNWGLRWGEIEMALAGARVAQDSRAFGAIGYRYQDFDTGVSLRWEQAQHGFRFAGDTDLLPTPLRQVTASASRRLGPGLSAGLLWLDTKRPNGERTRSAGVSASASLGAGVSLLLSANRIDDSGRRSTLASIAVSVPLGPRTSVSAAIDGGSAPRRSLSVQRALPIEEGYGYRLGVIDSHRTTRSEAATALQLQMVTLTAEAAKQSGQDAALRLGAAGGLAMIDGAVFAARPLVDSFALVRVPGVADVPIFINNQPAGRTDERGELIVPRITGFLPYEVRVDTDALPPDVEIRHDRVTVVPPYRSGVTAALDIRRSISALIRVVSAGGAAVPAGAVVQLEPGGQASGVAGNGQFFVSAEAGRKVAHLKWRGQSCTIEFELPSAPPPGGGAYFELGPFACPGIAP
jgi:outer membrane usher protein